VSEDGNAENLKVFRVGWPRSASKRRAADSARAEPFRETFPLSSAAAMPTWPSHTEVQQSLDALDHYAKEKFIWGNPFRSLPVFVSNLLAAASSAADRGASLGIEGSGVPQELLVTLHSMGFRRFSVPVGRRDEFRFVLGRPHKE
jgi:hypothetical protein